MINMCIVNAKNNKNVGGQTCHVDASKHLLHELKDIGLLVNMYILGDKNGDDIFTVNITAPVFNRYITKIVSLDEYMELSNPESGAREGVRAQFLSPSFVCFQKQSLHVYIMEGIICRWALLETKTSKIYVYPLMGHTIQKLTENTYKLLLPVNTMKGITYMLAKSTQKNKHNPSHGTLLNETPHHFILVPTAIISRIFHKLFCLAIILLIINIMQLVYEIVLDFYKTA